MPIYTGTSRLAQVRFRCFVCSSKSGSSCTAPALLCTMTGLFPSALFQTRRRRTRCLSVRLFFFFYFINFACVVFLKSWRERVSGARGRKAFCEAFSSFVTVVLQSALARHGGNKRLPTTIRTISFYPDRWWGLCHGVLNCRSNMRHYLRHIHQQLFMFFPLIPFFLSDTSTPGLFRRKC